MAVTVAVAVAVAVARVARSRKLSKAVVEFKDARSWQINLANGLLLDPHQKQLQWRHVKAGKILQREEVLVKAFGVDWKDTAKSEQWSDRKG